MTSETTQQKERQGIPQGYLGVQEVCKLFNVSRQTIYMMIAEGRLPKPFKSGRFNLWDQKEIERWIQNGKFLSRG